MTHFSKTIRLLFLISVLAVSASAIAATGRITDAQTGEPIAGATVYVVWYYHPITLGLLFNSNPSRGCDATAIATTDANGEYDVGWLKSLRSLSETAEIAVVAPGYYDPWKGRGRNDDLRADVYVKSLALEDGEPPPGMSRALRQLGDAPIDVKLLALYHGLAVDLCVVGRVEPYVAQAQFDQATYIVMHQAMCVKSGHTPSADVLRRIFGNHVYQNADWQLFVAPWITNDGPISELALDNLCSIAGWTRGPAAAVPSKPDDNLVLRIKLHRADSDEAVGKLPVRILWGWRKNPGTTFDRDHPLVSPVRSIVTESNAEGLVDLPVSSEMLREQSQFDAHRHDGYLNYVTEVLSDDQIAFSADVPPGRICDYQTLIDRTSRIQGNIQVINPCSDLHGSGGPAISVPNYSAGHGVSANEHASGSAMHQSNSTSPPGLMPGQDDSSMVALKAAAQLENKRRAEIKGIHAPDLANVYTYEWQWPSVAILKRAYELLIVNPTVEQNPEAFVALERNEVAKALDAFCTTEESLQARQDYEIVRLLWWADIQALGAESANKNAQQRSMDWDNGMRCRYAEGKTISMGGTRPANLLTREKVCSAWADVAQQFGQGPLASPPALSDFRVDYSKRDQACLDKPRMGSSL